MPYNALRSVKDAAGRNGIEITVQPLIMAMLPGTYV